MKKNDIIEVIIDGYSSDGSGVAKPDGYVLFIPGALRAERALVQVLKVGKSFGYAKVNEILLPSPERVCPLCEQSRLCGGCELWHMSYREELEFKRAKVLNNLKKANISELPVLSTGSVCAYRNKAQYPVREQGGEVRVGFYRRLSHDVIEGCCKIQPPVFDDISNAVKRFIADCGISAYNEQTCRGVLRHIYLRANSDFSKIMLCLVVNENFSPKSELVSKLTVEFEQISTICINYNDQKDNVILGERYEVIYGDGFITDTLCSSRFRISPQAFYQVNHDACQLLYSKVAEYANAGGMTVLDLYCGIGTIGICAARDARSLVGVEIVPSAVEDARFNARENGIENAQFFCCDAAGISKLSLSHFDVIIVDPPRRGCDTDTLSFIISQSPSRLVYVSCDSATLARDLEVLSAGGFHVSNAAAVDMFPRTKHVETVVLLNKVQN